MYLLRLFFDYALFQRYSPFLKKEFIRDNSKELYRLYEALASFHEKFPEKSVPSSLEFEVYFYSCYPATTAKDKDLLAPLFAKLDMVPDTAIAEDVIRNHVERVRATEIALMGMEVAEGRKTFLELSSALAEDVTTVTQPENDFVTDDLDELLDAVVRTPGLRWRLQSLNQHLGSLRKGDFGFIFKRPETGGTTFLASEATHFLGQSEGNILWVNNEEQGAKVKFRCYQALFGVPKETLVAESDKYKKLFHDKYAGRIRIVDQAAISCREVERILHSFGSPALIIFDQLDKIKGFSNDRTDLELKAIYQWARELAKEYAPVIGVCQASASAEGKKYLEMDDVDNSKTGKQGEADWILGIGRSHQAGYENLRHFHLCKNKLIGDADTIADRRHWRWEVLIRAEIARYEDCQ